MVDKVINLMDRLSDSVEAEDEERAEHDRFLLEEGLALLAAYRTIGDRDVRLSLMNLVQNIARAESRPENVGPSS